MFLLCCKLLLHETFFLTTPTLIKGDRGQKRTGDIKAEQSAGGLVDAHNTHISNLLHILFLAGSSLFKYHILLNETALLDTMFFFLVSFNGSNTLFASACKDKEAPPHPFTPLKNNQKKKTFYPSVDKFSCDDAPCIALSQ